MSDQYDRIMRNLCHDMGWPIPEQFTLRPINSPAVLVHWRVLQVLVGHLTEPQTSQFRRGDLGGIPPGTGARHVGLAQEHPQEISTPVASAPMSPQGISVTQVPTGPAPSASREPRLEAYDSHFHLDRIQGKCHTVPIPKNSDEIVDCPTGPSPAPVHPVDIIGGVEVYCDPSTYPKSLIRSPRWKIAVGIHPKHAGKLRPTERRKFATLVQAPEVVAVGEIGIDHSTDTSRWQAQEELLREVLGIHKDTCPGKPLVLHVRGGENDLMGRSAHERTLEALSDYCKPDQRIHLHCFRGCPETVSIWSARFPYTYFGLTGNIRYSNSAQFEAIRVIPSNRLLLETDSPYCPPRGAPSTNTPCYLGDVGAEVATVRNTTLGELLPLTVDNARQVYG